MSRRRVSQTKVPFDVLLKILTTVLLSYELFTKIAVVGDGKERAGVLRIGISGRFQQMMSCGTVEPCVVESGRGII